MKHLVHLGAEKQFFFFTHREETRHILSLCHVVEERKTEMRFCDFTFYIALYHVVCFERNLWQRRCCNPLQICKILVLIGPNSLDTNLEHWAFLLSYFRNFWWQKLLSEHSQQFYILLELHHLNFQLYFYIHLGITIWKIYNDNFLLSVNKNRCLNSRNLLIKLLSILYTLVEVWLHFCIGYLYCP